LKKYYNITLDDFNQKLLKQDHRCMICRETFQTRKSKAACVDHDHTTNQVRDILCGRCNSVVGYVDENPTLLEAAMGYLKKWKG